LRTHMCGIARSERALQFLDFGAGCGRMARFFAQAPQYKTYVCDVNPDLLAWCASVLPGVTAAKNGPLPPLAFEAETFDFVFALSVFTHLPESAALAWLKEVSRVLKPGGIAALSVHGRSAIDAISRSSKHQKHVQGYARTHV
jgi:ubiquinone/menaquinone biosynthesis C-methylase UbiE